MSTKSTELAPDHQALRSLTLYWLGDPNMRISRFTSVVCEGRGGIGLGLHVHQRSPHSEMDILPEKEGSNHCLQDMFPSESSNSSRM